MIGNKKKTKEKDVKDRREKMCVFFRLLDPLSLLFSQGQDAELLIHFQPHNIHAFQVYVMFYSSEEILCESSRS